MERPGVEYLARLARLRLGREEAARLERDLERMLTHFQALEEVDTTGVEPSPYPLDLADIHRPDREKPGLERDLALENAPAKREGCFQVPPIITGEGEG